MNHVAIKMVVVCVLLVGSISLAQQTLSDQVDQIFAQWDTTSSPGCAVAVVKDGQTLNLLPKVTVRQS